MGYTVKDPGSDFVPAPQGLHRAVCVDWVDLGVIESKFGSREKVRLVWEIDELMEDTKRRFIVSQMYTPSLHEKAKMRHDLESWRGRAFSAEERKGFDLDNLLGAPCQLQVVHNTHDDKTYANVASVVALGKGMERLLPSGDYIRMKDRPNEGGSREPGADDDMDDDDACPF
jgi:hypothetical protein